jgi:hypothetical protein
MLILQPIHVNLLWKLECIQISEKRRKMYLTEKNVTFQKNGILNKLC